MCELKGSKSYEDPTQVAQIGSFMIQHNNTLLRVGDLLFSFAFTNLHLIVETLKIVKEFYLSQSLNGM